MSTTAINEDVLTPRSPASGPRRPRSTSGVRNPGSVGPRYCPALVFMIIVTQLPFVATLVMSFLNWSAQPGAAGKSFAGISNYKEVFTNSAYRSAVWTSIIMTVTVVVISVLLGLGIALLLDHKFLGRGVVRTMMIAPFLIVPIAAAIFWGNGMLQTGFGLVDGVLGELGVQERGEHLVPHDAPEAVDRDRTDLAVDAVHDADPARRPAVA